jgi:DNA-binding winged helix-turn-helix (wHTH) protein
VSSSVKDGFMPQADPATSAALRPLVAESWRRSQAVRAGRDDTGLPQIRILPGDLDGYRAAHPLAVMLPMCRDLLGDAVREAGCVFALGDARGALLWVEGDPRTRSRVEQVHFVEGALWSEQAAGTNAPGTALVVGGPVQITGVEHFNEAVRQWSCTASPIRDPDSGRLLGFLDVTGGDVAAEAQMLALVRATTLAIESEFGRRVALGDLRAHEVYREALPPGEVCAALISPGGRILAASADLGLTRLPGLASDGQGTAQLPDGRRLQIEPVGVHGYVVVRFLDGPTEGDPLSPLRLSTLGRDAAALEIDGRSIRLSPRHSEILVLLAGTRDGLTTNRLAEQLSRTELSPTTLRVDMSRLRTLLGEEVLASRPYQLRRPLRTDVDVVEDLLREGRVQEACRVYAGPLLPRSQVPAIVRRREALADRLGAAVAASYDAGLLQRWLEMPWATEDLRAWDALTALLPEGSVRRVAVDEQVSRLRRSLGESPTS